MTLLINWKKSDPPLHGSQSAYNKEIAFWDQLIAHNNKRIGCNSLKTTCEIIHLLALPQNIAWCWMCQRIWCGDARNISCTCPDSSSETIRFTNHLELLDPMALDIRRRLYASSRLYNNKTEVNGELRLVPNRVQRRNHFLTCILILYSTTQPQPEQGI